MKKLLSIIGLLALAIGVQAQTFGTTISGNSSYTNALIVSTSPCKLFSVSAYNSSGSTKYVQIFQTNAVPPNAAVATWSYPVAATSFLSYDFSYYGADCYPGCTVVISTTANTLTLDTANCGIQAITRPSR